jgi:SAM-dependent methyltransferase
MKLLMEKAPQGLHDFCEVLIDKYFQKSFKILDIASGTGALARRLTKKGYSNIVANDIDSTMFEAKEIEFTSIDLNSCFSDEFGSETFDVICAIEIIEHLENPLSFIRECKKVLKDDGYLLITTPNVLGSESLIQWLRRGGFLYFSPYWKKSLGHISILPAWLLDAKLVECGFDIVYKVFTPRLIKGESSLGLRNTLGYFAIKVIDIILRGCGRSKREAIGTNYVVLSKKISISRDLIP